MDDGIRLKSILDVMREPIVSYELHVADDGGEEVTPFESESEAIQAARDLTTANGIVWVDKKVTRVVTDVIEIFRPVPPATKEDALAAAKRGVDQLARELVAESVTPEEFAAEFGFGDTCERCGKGPLDDENYTDCNIIPGPDPLAPPDLVCHDCVSPEEARALWGEDEARDAPTDGAAAEEPNDAS